MRRLRIIVSLVLAVSLPLQALAAVSVAQPAKACHGADGKVAPHKGDCCKAQHTCQPGQCCLGAVAHPAATAAGIVKSEWAVESSFPVRHSPQLPAYRIPLYRPPIALLS